MQNKMTYTEISTELTEIFYKINNLRSRINVLNVEKRFLRFVIEDEDFDDNATKVAHKKITNLDFMLDELRLEKKMLVVRKRELNKLKESLY